MSEKKKMTEEDKALLEAHEDKKRVLYNAIKAGNVENVKEALKFIEINVQDKYDMTAVHLAVKLGNKEIIQLLSDNGANLDVPGHEGKAVSFPPVQSPPPQAENIDSFEIEELVDEKTLTSFLDRGAGAEMTNERTLKRIPF